MHYLFLVLVAMLAPPTAASRAAAVASEPSISLVTIGPGRPFVSWMGHTLLLLRDSSGRTIEYQYGLFPANLNSVVGLASGSLTAHAERTTGGDPLGHYVDDGRSVLVQELHLTPSQFAALLDQLNSDALPEHRNYRYDYRTNNCTTRIRDLLDTVTGGALTRAGAAASGQSLRDIGRQYAAANLLVATFFDLVMNDEIDKPASLWDAAAFPDQLATLVAAAQLDEVTGAPRPLAQKMAFKPQTLPLVGHDLPLATLMIGLLLGGLTLLVSLGSIQTATPLALVTGIIGGVLGATTSVVAIWWTGGGYTFAAHNENLLVITPALVGTLPMSLMYLAGSRRAGTWVYWSWLFALFSTFIGFILKFAPAFDQQNWRAFMLIVPIELGMAFAWRRLSSQRAFALIVPEPIDPAPRQHPAP